MLRLPEKFTKQAKYDRAEEMMVLLGLKDVADVKVGGELVKGISGGEKRRLSLAVERKYMAHVTFSRAKAYATVHLNCGTVISNPNVLLVDEPSSGLDASIALNVIQALKDIAASGKTVIVTIHQPRSDIWQAIDNVMLLSGQGTMVVGYKFVSPDVV